MILWEAPTPPTRDILHTMDDNQWELTTEKFDQG